MEILHSSPTQSDFVALSEHQSQTPASFYNGSPILHHFSPNCTLKISQYDLNLAPAFAGLAAGRLPQSNGDLNGHDGGKDQSDSHDETEDAPELEPEVEIPSVDVWVTSERFVLFSPPLKTGLSIPYPSISLHAIQRPFSLYLQLLPSGTSTGSTFDDHDPDATISIIITPDAIPRPQSSAPLEVEAQAPSNSTNTDGHIPETSNGDDDEPTKLFTALSACANLHPDPPLPGDDEEAEDDEDMIDDSGFREQHEQAIGSIGGDVDGLPPAFPGSGGWITAENADQFFDEQGNWIGRVDGPGAGAVRRREQDDVGREDGDDAEELSTALGDSIDADAGVSEGLNNHNARDEPDEAGHGESGGSEATKWRRTG